MFLEISSNSKIDLVAYSQNIFDLDQNFRVIFKDDLKHRHKKINYADLCMLIKYPLKKNLILYRLLTNSENVNAASTKYGQFFEIDGKEELIYLDPIFALKDLGNIIKNFDPKAFRFKIQQVGVKTVNFKEGIEQFTQIYCFDLHAIEAQNQNDKIFADALFPEIDELELNAVSENLDISKNKEETVLDKAESKVILKEMKEEKIIEDKVESIDSFSEPKIEFIPDDPAKRDEKKELLKKVLGIENDLLLLGKDKLSDFNNANESREFFEDNIFVRNKNKFANDERKNSSVVLKFTNS